MYEKIITCRNSFLDTPCQTSHNRHIFTTWRTFSSQLALFGCFRIESATVRDIIPTNQHHRQNHQHTSSCQKLGRLVLGNRLFGGFRKQSAVDKICRMPSTSAHSFMEIDSEEFVSSRQSNEVLPTSQPNTAGIYCHSSAS